jgi:hypothetical protein
LLYSVMLLLRTQCPSSPLSPFVWSQNKQNC